MQPRRVYEYLALSRRRVLDRTRTLDSEQYFREFPIGYGTLAGTLTHIMISEWYYVERILGRDVPTYEQWPIQAERPPAFAVLEPAWAEQAAATQAAIESVRDWNAALQYHVTLDDGRSVVVTTTAGDLFTQLALHETHHRAQAMNILRQLGSPIGEDIDFNALMFDRRVV